MSFKKQNDKKKSKCSLSNQHEPFAFKFKMLNRACKNLIFDLKPGLT